MHRTKQLIQSHSTEALESECAVLISEDALNLILEMPQLKAREIEVVRFCSRWIDAHCRRQGLPVNRRNRQEMFNMIKPFILFDEMTSWEIVRSEELKSLLSDGEFRQLSTRQSHEPLLFESLTKRKGFRLDPSELRRNRWSSISLDLRRLAPNPPFRRDEPAPFEQLNERRNERSRLVRWWRDHTRFQPYFVLFLYIIFWCVVASIIYVFFSEIPFMNVRISPSLV